MSDPQMSPEELAWAFQNAGRAPTAQVSSSEAFAARARAMEIKNSERKAQLERGLIEQQYAQDRQWNNMVHAQDMEAARVHHRALLGEYGVVNDVRHMLDQEGFRQGMFWGIVAGLTFGWLFGRKG